MSEKNSPGEESPNREPRDVFIERAATKLFIHVWRAVQEGRIDARENIADAALALRDNLNPSWPNDPDWLPEPLASERQAHLQNSSEES